MIPAAQAQAFEYPQYTIEANVDTTLKKITATETVIFVNNSGNPVKEIYFHLYSNRRYTDKEKNFLLQYGGYFKVNPFPGGYESGRVTIDKILQENRLISSFVEGNDQTLLRIPLAEPLAPGAKTNLTLEFSVQIPHAYGRFGWHEDIFALSRWYPILSVLTDEGWQNNPFYPFHRPFYTDASEYNVELTVPAGFSAEVEASTGFGTVGASGTGLAVTEDGRKAAGRLGDGGPRITLRSGSGSVGIAIGK